MKINPLNHRCRSDNTYFRVG